MYKLSSILNLDAPHCSGLTKIDDRLLNQMLHLRKTKVELFGGLVQKLEIEDKIINLIRSLIFKLGLVADWLTFSFFC